MGILVIEAVHRSGTSVTAKLAISQDRKVFALPHEIWNSHGTGTNRLIKSSAILVTDTEDILQEFKYLRKLIRNLNEIEKINLNSLDVDFEIFESAKKSSDVVNPFNTKAFLNSSSGHHLNFDSSMSPNIHSSNDLKSLVTQNKKELKDSKLSYIYDLITLDPITINELCKKTSKPIAKISNDLFLLEIKGYIKKVAGGYICILNK